MASVDPPPRPAGLAEADALARVYGVDPRALGAFRVAFGLVLLCDLGLRFQHRALLYANDGVLSNHFLSFAPVTRPEFTIYGAFSTTEEVTVAFLLTACVYCCYTIGFCARAMQVLALVLVSGLVARNPLAMTPGDPFLCALAAFSAFLPLGERFSIDAVRQSLAARRELAVHALPPPLPVSTLFASVAALGVIVQTSLVLGLSAVGDYRDHGLHWALFHDAVATPLGGALRGTAGVVAALSHSLCGLSALAAILLLLPRTFPRAVLVGIVATMLVGLGLGSLLCLGMLPFALAAAAILRVPGSVFDRAGAALARGVTPAVLVFSATDAGLLGVARLLSRLDAYGRLSFVDRADAARLPPGLPEGVVALYENGQWHVGSTALVEAVRTLPGGGGFAPLLASAPGRMASRAVLRRRTKLALSWGFPRGAPFEAVDPPEDPPLVSEGYDVLIEDAPSPLQRWFLRVSAGAREFLAGTLLLLVVLDAVHEAAPLLGRQARSLRPPAALSWVLAYPQITQRWGLLSPFHEREDGALVVDLTLGDGTHLDPFTNRIPERTRSAPRFGDSALWTAYTRRIRRPEAAVYRDELKRAIRSAARGRNKDVKVSQAEILWAKRASPEPGQPLSTVTTEEALFGNR